MPKYRITVTRVYEADVTANSYEEAEEIAEQLSGDPASFLVIDDDVEIIELQEKSEAREVA